MELKELLKKGGYILELNDPENEFYFNLKNVYVNEKSKTINIFKSLNKYPDYYYEKIDSQTVKITKLSCFISVTYYYDIKYKELFKIKIKNRSGEYKILYRSIIDNCWKKAKIIHDHILYETHVIYD